jgi:hypothetical protein
MKPLPGVFETGGTPRDTVAVSVAAVPAVTLEGEILRLVVVPTGIE